MHSYPAHQAATGIGRVSGLARGGHATEAGKGDGRIDEYREANICII